MIRRPNGTPVVAVASLAFLFALYAVILIAVVVR